MAAKDADLARDYSVGKVALSSKKKAAMIVAFDTTPNHPPAANDVFIVQSIGPSGGGGVVYRMRGIDGDLGYTVYWESVIVDKLAVDYPGNSGALTDIVVSEVIGS